MKCLNPIKKAPYFLTNIIMSNNNNLSECEFNVLYPVPYTNQNQSTLFPYIKIQKPEHAGEEAQCVQDRSNVMMASLLKKAEQEQEEIDCDGDDDCDDVYFEDDEAQACARLRLADLARIARFSRLELEEAALDIPKLVRQTTGMVVNGKTVYNGCPSGARLLRGDCDVLVIDEFDIDRH